MNSSGITEKQILEALSKVDDPELNKDLVSLNMIRDVQIDGDKVSFTLVLTTPACPLRAYLEAEAKRAVSLVPGVKEVVIKTTASVPAGKPQMENLIPGVKHTIAISSGKGGVGKSTVAVNLAVALANKGAAVGLLDADIYGPNIPVMVGVKELPPATETKLIPAEAYGLKIMSIGFLVKPGQPIIWRGPMLHTAIHQFIADVEWGCLDYLVIDLPPGTGDAQLSLGQTVQLSGGIIVTTPQQVSLEDASRGVQMFREMKIPILGVVENMAGLVLPDGTRLDVFGAGGGEILARQTRVPFLGSIPLDPDVRIGGDAGAPISSMKSNSPAALAFDQIASKVAAFLSIHTYQQN